MTHKFFLILLTTCFFFHCGTTTNDPITEELMSLTTITDKKNYLEKIYIDSEGGTKNLPANIAEINLQKIGTYLELFGYPKKVEIGLVAAKTPWLIINSNKSQDELETRRKYFPILFKGFLNGDINDVQMSMFLKRFYEGKNGTRYNGESITGSKEEINLLIGLLNLETSLN